jgi:acyl-CoA synthetase (AMP-forming)/AMP-acid ligase II
MTKVNAASDIAAEPVEIPDMRLPEFVLGEARSRGAKTALVEADTGWEISYARLADAVRDAAQWLAGVGVRPGDVVGLCAPGGIEFVIAWYATLSAGAVVTSVNPVSVDAEIATQFRRTGTRWLITTEALFASKLAAAAEQAPGLSQILLFGAASDPAPGADPPADGASPAPAVRRFDVPGARLVPGGHDASGRTPEAGASSVSTGLSSDELAWLAPSSGTTGRPKIVMLTHRNMVAGLDIIMRTQRATERDVTIAVVPLFHVYGLQATLNAGLKRGATIVILPRFELGAFLRAVQDHRVTRAEIVPPIAVLLAKSELVDEFDLSSLRLLTSAAAPLRADVARACAQRLGVRVNQAYGMTEVAGGTHFGLDDGPDHPDSVGPALPGVQCRVVDPDTGQDLGPGEPGELLVRTPGMMRGYLDDPAATAATIDAGGWLHTGDVVTADADGWYRVTDRIKELIKYKGFQVAPAELEDVLLAHPAVADVAVVQSPDESAGEVPKAFVVRRLGAVSADGADGLAQELMTWVAERVAPYKRVRRVEFTDSIPKSAAGKILRRQLIEREYQAAAARRHLSGMVVLVTGGGRGLGRLLAAELARAGAAVGLLARTPGELADTVAEIEREGGTAAAVTADVTDRQSLAAGQLGPGGTRRPALPTASHPGRLRRGGPVRSRGSR